LIDSFRTDILNTILDRCEHLFESVNLNHVLFAFLHVGYMLYDLSHETNLRQWLSSSFD